MLCLVDIPEGLFFSEGKGGGVGSRREMREDWKERREGTLIRLWDDMVFSS